MPRKTREERIQAWVDKVQPTVGYCLGCQPVDSGEYIWVRGDRIDVESHLVDLRVPQDIQEEVAGRLHCGDCGNGEFGLYDDIGLYTREERDHSARWRAWGRKFSKKLDDFGAFLSRHPYLGAAHPLGREIRRMIAGYERTEIETATWWRARRADGARKFVAKEMLPPKEALSEGRFNHYGQSAFYLAAEAETALAETLDHEKNEVLAWVQAFRLPKIADSLDLIGPDWDEEDRVPLLALGLLSHIDRLVPQRDSPWKPEYFVPRYIADCAKEAGFKAIRFRSARALLGTNLVLFESDAGMVEAVGEPEIRAFVPKEPDF